MRRRECFTIIALLTATIVSAKANQPAPTVPAPTPAPTDASRADGSRSRQAQSSEAAAGNSARETEAEVNLSEASSAAPSPLVLKDKALGSAYFNTLSILSTSNSCSDFFGGAAAAVDAFKELMGNVRKEYLTTKVGMTMSGETVNVYNSRTNSNYRLFSKVSINANGPFYRKRLSPLEPPLPRLGSFEANTKEVRVLMFLHELGHVMKGDDGNWLLPNDGKSDELSHQNTQKIEDVCGSQIKNLDHEGKSEAQPVAAH
jgi:hypothetical protein